MKKRKAKSVKVKVTLSNYLRVKAKMIQLPIIRKEAEKLNLQVLKVEQLKEKRV